MMPERPSNLERRTKAEILAEYDKLLERLEEVQQKAKAVSEPASQEMLRKAAGVTEDKTQAFIVKLQEITRQSTDKLAEALMSGSQQVIALREEAEAVRQELEVGQDTKIAADALEILVADYETKKRQQKLEAERARQELMDELASKRKQWEREQEERNYKAVQERREQKDEQAGMLARREGELDGREEELVLQEEEISGLRKRVEELPKQVEEAVKAKDKERRARLEMEFSVKTKQIRQEAEAVQKIDELKIRNLEDVIKQQRQEIKELKQEAERATKRAQDLAVAIIKHPQPVEGGEKMAEEEVVEKKSEATESVVP